MTLKEVITEYLANSSLHGVKFIVDQDNSYCERVFWTLSVILSWVASGLLMRSSWEAFQNNAISFVVESSYRDWDTDFPAIVVCEIKNVDRLEDIADQLWGEHDFTLEEVLSEIVYFRGESFHTIEECGEQTDNSACISSNFTYYARLGRSDCARTLANCSWNAVPFDCCVHFALMETELGICYALNSAQVPPQQQQTKMSMLSNRYTGLGQLRMEVLTEANVYTLGVEDVPNLVSPKSEYFTVGPYISYQRQIAVRNIENDPQTRAVSVQQRSCRFPDENTLDVHRLYSYSACSVQCRKNRQLALCNCTSHLMPNTARRFHCKMEGLRCLNDNYEELSVVIASWSHERKGLVCDCLPSCTEIDVSVVHDARFNMDEAAAAEDDGSEEKLLRPAPVFNETQVYDDGSDDDGGEDDYEEPVRMEAIRELPRPVARPVATVKIALSALPTERYKRNVVRGTLDLVVSMGGATGLFIGASLLSFVEIVYYFTVRPYGTMVMRRRTAMRITVGSDPDGFRARM